MNSILKLIFISIFIISWDLPNNYKKPNYGNNFKRSSNSNLKYLPNNTIAISSINIGSVMEKSNYKKIMETDLMGYLFEEMRDEDVPRRIRNFIRNPESMGFDINESAYFYLAHDPIYETEHEDVSEVLVNLFYDLKNESIEYCSDIKDPSYYTFISSSVKEKWNIEIEPSWMPYQQ